MLDESFEPVRAVLADVGKGDIKEIIIDISSKNSEVTKYLGGCGTFVGQWEDHYVVIMMREEQMDCVRNLNTLTAPFHDDIINGPILLIRMDCNALPKDLTLKEVQESKLFL
jgi:ribosomal protein L21E